MLKTTFNIYVIFLLFVVGFLELQCLPYTHENVNFQTITQSGPFLVKCLNQYDLSFIHEDLILYQFPMSYINMSR